MIVEFTDLQSAILNFVILQPDYLQCAILRSVISKANEVNELSCIPSSLKICEDHSAWKRLWTRTSTYASEN